MSEEELIPLGFFTEYDSVLRFLQDESDRGVVLVAAGFFEQQLIALIRSYLLENRVPTTLHTGGNTPLGTFNARIDIAYALGLIDDESRADLHLIRRIRNDFAHDWSVGFENRRVIDRCAALHYAVQPTNDDEESAITPRDKFISGAAVVMVMLALNEQIAKENRLAQLPRRS